MANSVDPDQTALLFASLLNLSVMLGSYLQQMTFSDAFLLGACRVIKTHTPPSPPIKNHGNNYTKLLCGQSI